MFVKWKFHDWLLQFTVNSYSKNWSIPYHRLIIFCKNYSAIIIHSLIYFQISNIDIIFHINVWHVKHFQFFHDKIFIINIDRRIILFQISPFTSVISTRLFKDNSFITDGLGIWNWIFGYQFLFYFLSWQIEKH